MKKTPKRKLYTSVKDFDQSFLQKLPRIDESLNSIGISSFNRFLKVKVQKILNSFFPIYSTNKLMRIELKKIEIGKPKNDFSSMKNKRGSYEFPINLVLELFSEQKDERITFKNEKKLEKIFGQWIEQKLELTELKLTSQTEKKLVFKFENKKTNESLELTFYLLKKIHDTLYFDFSLRKIEELYFGSYPQITEKGTFLINGIEKVVVLQLVRSPGIFSKTMDSISEFETYKAEVIPKRGTWIDFLTKMNRRKVKNNYIYSPTIEILIDKSKTHNILISNLFTLFGFEEKYIRNFFSNAEEIVNAYESLHYISDREDSIKAIYAKLFENTNSSVETKFQAIIDAFFSEKKFFLSEVGRYKINQKLFLGNLLYGRILAEDLVDKKTKKILFSKGTWIGKKEAKSLNDFFNAGNNLITLPYLRTVISGKGVVQVASVYADNALQEKIIKVVGVDPAGTDLTLNVSDVVAITAHIINLSYDIGSVDDIDSLGNRNVHLIEELLEDQFRYGFRRIVDESNRKINDILLSKYNHRIVSLINFGPLINSVREFFNVSPLVQFLDQINPLTELANKRRITVLGDGGLKRTNVSSSVRDVHSSYLGKICPIETPEGPNIGLISNLSYFSRINEWNFIQTPYWKVVNGKITGETVYLSAIAETNAIIAPPETKINDQGYFFDPLVTVYFRDNLMEIKPEEIEYLGYSSFQMFSITAAAIPFLENNDANRALMGANMQKQAVPLIRPNSPRVGTGVEEQIARDSGFSLIATKPGKVVYVDSTKISVAETGSKNIKDYLTTDFLPSNQRTALYHRVCVKKGDEIIKNDVLADGVAIDNGELALGKDILVGFMTWKGYNYEDALIISDRLVKDDVLTSLHVEEYEIRRMRTKLGDEEFTREVVNSSEKARRFLDEDGIVLVGSEVGRGDILVGKITPKDKGQRTPEDILLNQLFKGREQSAENNSLFVPTGVKGIVQNIKRFTEKDLKDTLSGEVIEVIKVYIAKKISIKTGDKLASRHGNKGVVSHILPANSMPYMADGRIIDIMINPLGVPSRMNVGQLLEMHFGYAASKLNIKIACPVFLGPKTDTLKKMMNDAKVSPNGKEVLYDGETGEPFISPIAIGLIHYMKLSHMVENKIHSREIGPYTLVTQQPLKGKAQNGGQRFGEMEVWALESYGAAYNLRELLTIKSDDIKGRNAIYQSLINDTPRNFSFNYFPESFNVLMAEIKSLCLNIEIIEDPTDPTNILAASQLLSKSNVKPPKVKKDVAI